MIYRKIWQGFVLLLLCHTLAVVVLAAPQAAAHSVTLAWSPVVQPDNETIESWNIYRSTATGSPYTLIANVPVDAVTYVDSSVVAGNQYFYIVTSVDTAGEESAYSDTAEATVPADGVPLFITTAALPTTTTGITYSVMLSAAGGTAPYTWIGDGVPGLTVSPTGLLAGTPTQAGTFISSVTVADSMGLTASTSIPLIVADPVPPLPPPVPVEPLPVPPPTISLPSGLILYWTFDDADTLKGVAPDKSGNMNAGMIFGNPPSVPGVRSQALDFGNSTSYLAATDSAAVFSNSLTLVAWIDTAGTSETQTIFSKYSADGIGAGYIFSVNQRGNLTVRIGGADLSSFPRRATDPTVVADGKWHHVVATISFESQSIQFHVDGQMTSSTSMNMLPNGDGGATLQVGANPWGSQRDYLTGAMDEVQIYNRALTDPEVRTVYLLTGGSQ